MSLVDRKLKLLESLSLKKGAYRARVFDSKLVVVDERVRLKCQIPLCPHFGNCLTCPPNVITVDEFTRVLGKYGTALLLQTRSSITGKISDAEKKEVLEYFAAPGKKKSDGGEGTDAEKSLHDMKLAAIRLHKLVNEVESEAMTLGFHYAVGLIGGECMLCTKCVGVASGQACRRPFQARPSMEGVGIDVIKTSKNAGLPFDLPPKDDIVWSGMILLD